jgi:hypothetical protein
MKRAELFQTYTRPRTRVRVAVEACRGGSAHVQAAAAMVIGEVVRTCGPRCYGVWWLERMVEEDYGGRIR